MAKHEVITCATANYLEPGFRFYHGPSPKELVRDMLTDLLEISERSYCHQKERFKDELHEIHDLRRRAKEAVNAADGKSAFREKAAHQKLDRLCQRFEQYLMQLTVLLFNGGR